MPAPVSLFASYLPALYSSRRTLADAWPEPGIGAPVTAAASTVAMQSSEPVAPDEDSAAAAEDGTGAESDPSI
jgi:hypothetical protein